MRVTTVAALLAGALVRSASADDWRPVLSEPLADPQVYFEDGYWYVYGTAWHCFVGRELSPGEMKRVDQHLDFGELGGPYQVWRFTVYKHTDGTYHAYVTIHFGNFRTGLAHFVPAEGEEWQPGAPITRWVLAAEIIPGPDPDAPSGGYDIEAVRDEDGTLYILYVGTPPGAEGGHIMAQRMLSPYEVDRTFTPRPILSPEGFRSEDRNPGYIQLIEGPRISRVGGKYILTYSVGDFAYYEGHRSNYKIGVAYSDALIPPEGRTYEKALVPDADNVWGNEDARDGLEVCYPLQSQIDDWPNYCGDWVEGPGHGTILDIEGEPHLFLHGYPTGENKDRYPTTRWDWMLPLAIDIDDDRPMAEWVRVVLPGEE